MKVMHSVGRGVKMVISSRKKSMLQAESVKLTHLFCGMVKQNVNFYFVMVGIFFEIFDHNI